ncbi:hypothetical protein D7X48_19670 [bacterium D16-50]|nr:hypothetical protein D7X48_19670 [bacterium D16-50]
MIAASAIGHGIILSNDFSFCKLWQGALKAVWQRQRPWPQQRCIQIMGLRILGHIFCTDYGADPCQTLKV